MRTDAARPGRRVDAAVRAVVEVRGDARRRRSRRLGHDEAIGRDAPGRRPGRRSAAPACAKAHSVACSPSTRETCMRCGSTSETRSSRTCAGAGFSSVVTVTAPKRCSSVPPPPVERGVVRAADRHLERARKARLVGPRLALERRERGAELLAPDGIDPPGREGDEVVGLGLRGRRTRARLCQSPSRHDRVRLDDVRPELEEAHRGDGGERPRQDAPVQAPPAPAPRRRARRGACARRRPQARGAYTWPFARHGSELTARERAETPRATPGRPCENGTIAGRSASLPCCGRRPR